MEQCIWRSSRGWMGARLGAGRIIHRLVLPREERADVLAVLDGGSVVEGSLRCLELARAIEDLFAGRCDDLPWHAVADTGTAFQRRLWQETARIPRGRTVTYGHLARLVGSPRAARAVGQAMGANPLPLLVPCHRVTASVGLGGYGGGLELKRFLLALEGVDL